MTTINIFKGFLNTLSFSNIDTHHKPLKDPLSSSISAINDLNSLISLTKGDNLTQKTLYKPRTLPMRSFSVSKMSRFLVEDPEIAKTPLIMEKSSTFRNKAYIEGNVKAYKEATPIIIKPKRVIVTKKEMSGVNFNKYLSFLSSKAFHAKENLNLTPNRKNSHLNNSKSLLRLKRNSISYNKVEPFIEGGRIKTGKKSFIGETGLIEKMGAISGKIMQYMRRLEKMNNFNRIKTFNDLRKLFNGNTFLENLFFDLSGKDMNPKLNESLIAQSIIIYPSKFNRNPLENRIKHNYEGVKALEKLSFNIKDLCFSKKLLNLQNGEKDMVELQKSLKKLENSYKSQNNSLFGRKLELGKTTIEIKPSFNSQISRMLKGFEEKHGKLDKIKLEKKIVGQKVDNMMQGLYENFIYLNEKEE